MLYMDAQVKARSNTYWGNRHNSIKILCLRAHSGPMLGPAICVGFVESLDVFDYRLL